MTPIIVTGAAGFIGAAVSRRLLDLGESVVGIDSLNSYYPVKLKQFRLKGLQSSKNFAFHPVDISHAEEVATVAGKFEGAKIIHLAAQAGVRHSITAPQDYVSSNLVGFANIAELARRIQSEHLVYASTSSVYGLNRKLPFSEGDSVRHPLNLYSATKLANESIAHAYSHLFGIPTTGLRFFTVYGPAGRPDMSPLIFARHLLAGTEIPLFAHGTGTRDYTFIDDIVEGVLAAAAQPPVPSTNFDFMEPARDQSSAAFAVYNIGAGAPVTVSRFLALLASALSVRPRIDLLDAQEGDMESTYADTTAIQRELGWRPACTLEEGIGKLVQWCLAHPDLLHA